MNFVKKFIVSTLMLVSILRTISPMERANPVLSFGSPENAKKFAQDYFALPENRRTPIEYLVPAFFALNLQYPVHEAAKYALMPILKHLIKICRFKLNTQDEYGNQPLHCAASSDNPEAINFLLTIPRIKIEALNASHMTPLIWAAFNGKVNSVKALLAAHANPNSQDISGNTPLHYACMNKQTDLVRILLTTPEIKINATNRHGMTPLQCTSEPEIIAMLRVASSNE